MIDSIALVYEGQIPDRQLGTWSQHNGGRFSKNLLLENMAVVKLSYLTGSPIYTPRLRVEFSVPKVLYGYNFAKFSVEDIYSLFTLFDEWRRLEPLLSGLDLSKGIIKRIDFYYDHQVGGQVSDYLAAIGRLVYPHRSRHCYDNNHPTSTHSGNDNGVMFQSRQISTKFYDKELEARDLRAFGLLRQEVTLTSPVIINKQFGRRPTLLSIIPTVEVVAGDLLRRDLAVLSMDKSMTCTDDSLLQDLQKHYGSARSLKLYALLSFMRTHPGLSEARLAQVFCMSRSFILAAKRDIKGAGFSLGYQLADKQLAPLHID